jgi:hypothetical protein
MSVEHEVDQVKDEWSLLSPHPLVTLVKSFDAKRAFHFVFL